MEVARGEVRVSHELHNYKLKPRTMFRKKGAEDARRDNA